LPIFLNLFPTVVQKKVKSSKRTKELKPRTTHFESIPQPMEILSQKSLDGALPGSPAVDPGAVHASKYVGPLTEVQLDIIDICVRASQAIGIPRSVGEIFGLIFSSPRPVSFEDVVRLLGISSGSASHGLRKMCRLGIIHTCYVPRDRRDHYTFESAFRNLALALLEENLLVHVCWAEERIERLRERVLGDSRVEPALADRVETLSNWNSQARTAMKRALESLK